MASSGRVAPKRGRPVDPHHPPFSSFLERDALREQRQRGRRVTLIVSITIHAVALLALLFYSFFHVDELFGPSVEVKMFAPGAAPSGAYDQDDANRSVR